MFQISELRRTRTKKPNDLNRGSGFFKSMHDKKKDVMKEKLKRSVNSRRLDDGTFNNGKNKTKEK